MSMEVEYRAYAAKSIELANRAADTAEKSHLLAMAEAWLSLAEKMARQVTRPKADAPEHPAVHAVLGSGTGRR